MQIDGSIEFKPADQQVLHHGDSLVVGKARTDYKPTPLEYQLSPGTHVGIDGRHAHKTQ